jgi:UDP-N-acetylmuramoyl-tripeptide--D-alanyl-D-alanine ligase
LCQIANPDFGLITNVGKAHLEGFGGFEGVKKGKGELYDFIAAKEETIFINADNYDLLSMAEKAGVKSKVSYGSKQEYDCWGKVEEEFPALKISWKAKLNTKVHSIRANLTGGYNLENILAAVCIGNYFGVEAGKINAAVEEYVPSNNRSQVVTKGTNTIILDCYNANPTSMTAALVNFSGMKAKNKVVILGDMLELGSESEALHKTVIEQIGGVSPDAVILIGKEFASALQKEKIDCKSFATTDEAKEYLSAHKFQDATILVKGSRGSRLEKLFEVL